MPAPDPNLEQAELCLIWSLDEGSEHARRGHAYVFAEREQARWVALEHSPSATPQMLEILARWEAAHPPTPALELRRTTQWVDPATRWRFHGDIGGVRELLLTRRLVRDTHEFGQGEPPEPLPEPLLEPLPELPQAFLTAPIACLVRAQLGPLDWPSRLEAPDVCVGPRGLVSARMGDELVVCAARPDSIHAGSGQTRTAAVWCSHDGGARWEQLSWALDPDHDRPPSWPPEQIERVSFDSGAPVIEWEDPWSDWEPGYQWRGVWSPSEARWRVTTSD